MPHNRSDDDEPNERIDFADTQRISLGQTFHKTGTPRIVWSIARITPDKLPLHVVLTMRGDATTRITISVHALTNRHYFRPTTAEAQ